MVKSRRFHMALSAQKSATWPLAGHADLGRHLIHQMRSGRLAQVVLFVGPRAVGKGSAAKWLMRAQLCTSKTDQPCDSCSACRQTLANAHPNSLILESDEQETIGIEAVRQVIQQYELVSWNKVWRWLIIVDAERLTEAAANTMLKFLEEIPPRLQVLMTSSQPELLIPTLRSRATTYQWHLVAPNEVASGQPADRSQIARSAGRPGWFQSVAKTAAQKDLEQAHVISEQFIRPETARPAPSKDRAATEALLDREELVVRDLLLASVGSRRRQLWPIPNTREVLSSTAAVGLVEKYLDRYELSSNLQPRLLYEDLHLV